MCCSVLQCVAVCCSVLQCVAVMDTNKRLQGEWDRFLLRKLWEGSFASGRKLFCGQYCSLNEIARATWVGGWVGVEVCDLLCGIGFFCEKSCGVGN